MQSIVKWTRGIYAIRTITKRSQSSQDDWCELTPVAKTILFESLPPSVFHELYPLESSIIFRINKVNSRNGRDANALKYEWKMNVKVESVMKRNRDIGTAVIHWYKGELWIAILLYMSTLSLVFQITIRLLNVHNGSFRSVISKKIESNLHYRSFSSIEGCPSSCHFFSSIQIVLFQWYHFK